MSLKHCMIKNLNVYAVPFGILVLFGLLLFEMGCNRSGNYALQVTTQNVSVNADNAEANNLRSKDLPFGVYEIQSGHGKGQWKKSMDESVR